jgi:hypothetical protein
MNGDKQTKLANNLEKKKLLTQLLEKLEAAGPDPHGEIDWGKDVGKERWISLSRKDTSRLFK